jgi:hypothetical protein
MHIRKMAVAADQRDLDAEGGSKLNAGVSPMTLAAMLLMLICRSTISNAQTAADQLLAAWTDVNYETLYKTTDGRLVYRRSNSDADGDFYERDTLPLSAVTSITMEQSDVVDDFVITIAAQENSVLEERHVGGQQYEHQRSSLELLVPSSDKSTADSVRQALAAATGK